MSCSCSTWLKFSYTFDYFAGYCDDIGQLGRRRYWLCYDKDAQDGTNPCRSSIEPQPQLGELHPEQADPNRTPYNLLIESIDQETGNGETEYLTVRLWMQENREPTEAEVKAFRERIDQDELARAEQDYRYKPELPLTRFTLKYRFVRTGGDVLFEASDDKVQTIQ